MINIEIQHKGILLRGVADVVGHSLVVNLLEPVRGQKYVNYGWASAVCKSPYWTDSKGCYTESGLGMAGQLLKEIYEEAQPEYKARKKEIKIRELKRKIEKIENEG